VFFLLLDLGLLNEYQTNEQTGFNVLHYAVSYNQPIQVRILVEKYNFDVNKEANSKQTSF
jgi:ankyrin repeat protein